jgi:hypothetical protein
MIQKFILQNYTCSAVGDGDSDLPSCTTAVGARGAVASATAVGHDGSVGHTPQVLMQGRKKTDSYYNSPVILLGLVPCNPTRTPAL